MGRLNRKDFSTAIPQLEGMIDEVETKVEEVKNSMTKKSELLDFFYPIGTIYETSNDTFNPNTTWGGTWSKIEGKVLVGLDNADFNTVGATGGEKEHTLTIDEMPSHDHIQRGSTSGTIAGSGRTRAGYSTEYSGSTTASTGGGQPHNNMPPYEVVVIWKRTS